MPVTYGTEHLSLENFNAAYKAARPGDQILYAIGDLATSRHIGPEGKELDAMAVRAMHLAEHGLICLTQRAMPELQFRFGGGRCFEYMATKCQPKKVSVRTQSPRSSSLADALVTA